MTDNNNEPFGSKLKDVSLIFFGAIIVVICLALYRSNIHIFTVFLCLYFGMYAIIVIIYLYKKTNSNTTEFDMVINISLYTICLIVSLILFTLYTMVKNSNYKMSSRY
jgi:multidrug efflux pump subunit AcrB